MSRDTALLVIDVQTGQIERGAYQGGAVVARIRQLVEQARDSETPIIYIQHDGDPDGALAVGTRGWHICPEIEPAAGELIVRKRASDSFHETTLERELRARAIAKLVIVGLRTEYCVDTTCRRGTTLGYDVTLVADAHTTTDNEILSAAQIIAHHNATLDDFGNDAHVVTIERASEIVF